MFYNGDNSYLSDVFDKSKSQLSEIPKTSIIELRSITQTLLQRVDALETAHINDTKVINSLKQTVTELQTKNSSLISDIEKSKHDFVTHASHCESFRKTTKDRLKCLDGLDHTEEQAKFTKINSELTRLSRLCTSLQKQISDTKMSKTFAAVASSPPKSPTSQTRKTIGSSQVTDCVQITPTSSPAVNGKGVRSPVSVPHDQQDCVKNTDNCAALTVIHEANGIPKSSSEQKTENPYKPKPSINFKSLDPPGNRGNKDIFLGVTYKKSARYFLSGVNKDSTHDGIKQFLESKGVHVTHLALFKPKGRFSVRTAKINVSPQYSNAMESTDFWPEGVRCRKWYNEREWSKLCEQRDSQQYSATDGKSSAKNTK